MKPFILLTFVLSCLLFQVASCVKAQFPMEKPPLKGTVTFTTDNANERTLVSETTFEADKIIITTSEFVLEMPDDVSNGAYSFNEDGDFYGGDQTDGTGFHSGWGMLFIDDYNKNAHVLRGQFGCGTYASFTTPDKVKGNYYEGSFDCVF